MGIRVIFVISAVIFVGLLFFNSIPEVNGDPAARRGGSGGRSGGGSRFGGGGGGQSSRGSKHSSYGTGSSKGLSGGYKPSKGGSSKSFARKHWKKAVAFGAGAVIGYQAGKLVHRNNMIYK